MNKVLNLSTGEYVAEYTCTPREAVIAAHAQFGTITASQSRGDFNTWDYESKYGHLVMTGKHSVSCGDFACLSK